MLGDIITALPTTMNTFKVVSQSLLGFTLKASGLDDSLIFLEVALRQFVAAVTATKKGSAAR
jgi:hypothetical protein